MKTLLITSTAAMAVLTAAFNIVVPNSALAMLAGFYACVWFVLVCLKYAASSPGRNIAPGLLAASGLSLCLASVIPALSPDGFALVGLSHMLHGWAIAAGLSAIALGQRQILSLLSSFNISTPR